MFDNYSNVSSELDTKFDEVLSDIHNYKKSLEQKIGSLQSLKSQVLQQIEKARQDVSNERVEVIKEKQAWEIEKTKIQSMQPLEEIVELNVGGKEDLCVRRSTLCHVQGSALAAMFSGRHVLQKKNDRVFIDRNPLAFNMMIDFIRNQGELHEMQLNNQQMLQMELKYWGIEDDVFHDRTRNKFEILQDVFDRSVPQFFETSEGSNFFYKYLEESRLNF